jgi:KDO2-lipid IV(A) lauroyltransferase
MGRPRSKVTDYCIYVVVRLVVCLIQSLSFEAARTLAGGLAWLDHQLDRRHRQVACENLDQAFPGQLGYRRRAALVYGVYEHFCRLLIEIIHVPRRMHLHNWRRHLEVRNGHLLIDSLLSGRPLLIVTGHYGNWEFGGYAIGLLGFKTYAVARPLDNPYLDDFLRQFREATGQKLLAKKGDFGNMQELMRQGGVLATLADQDAGQRGLFVDFFGRPASTHKAVALLAIEHRVPILILTVRRIGEPFHYEACSEEVILPEDYEGRADAVRAITQRFTKALEQGIRRDPSQYFWLHRRWKHQPQKRTRTAA